MERLASLCDAVSSQSSFRHDRGTHRWRCTQRCRTCAGLLSPPARSAGPITRNNHHLSFFSFFASSFLLFISHQLVQETYRNDTPLHLAARRANPLVISYLVDMGCKMACNMCEVGPSSCSSVDKKVSQFVRQLRTQVRTTTHFIFALLCRFSR